MWKTYLGKRLLGFKFATKGAWMLLRNEASIQVQAVVAVGVTIAGFCFDISYTEWIAQTLAIGLVISIEGLNTAVEEMANFVHPDYHNRIGYIKDVAAGAVFFAAVVAVIVACLIYIPKF